MKFILAALLLHSLSAPAAENCRQIKDTNVKAVDGVYDLSIQGQTFRTHCDMQNGGWTLLARTPRSWERSQPVTSQLSLTQPGRLPDLAWHALLQTAVTTQNNIKIEVEDSFPPYTVSMQAPAHGEKGIYQVGPEDNGYCSAFSEEAVPAIFTPGLEWKWINGSMTGGIGYSESWGFHVDVCDASSAMACGAKDEENCDEFLRGSLWIL